MTRLKRPGIWIGLALITLIGMGTCMGQQHAQQAKIKAMIEKMEKNKQTVCVGRFLIDLPDNARIKFWGQRPGIGVVYFSPRITQDQFKTKVAQRVKELTTSKNRQGESYLDRVVDLGVPNAAMIYFRDDDWGKENNVKAEVYYWFGGTLLQAQHENLKLEYLDEVIKNWKHRLAITPMRARADTEIPYEPGFCVEGAFFPGAPKPGEPHSEMVEIQFELTDRKDVQFRLLIMTHGLENAKSLLERAKDNDVRQMLGSNVRSLRMVKRNVGPLKGDELAERFKEENNTESHAFEWESLGKPNSVYSPSINFEMKTGWQASEVPMNSSLTDDEALAIWDAILSTLRLRPESPPPQSSLGNEPTLIRPTIPLGTRLPSGAHCPQAGVWACDPPDAQVQSFAKGELMPTIRYEKRQWLRTRVKEYATIWTLRRYGEESDNG